MCWAGRCCYFIKLNRGGIFIGFISLVLSLAMVTTSGVYLSMDIEETKNSTFNSPKELNLPLHQHIIIKLMTLELTQNQWSIILYSTLTMGMLLMFASMMLIIGISKKKPNCVVFYFGFGIFFAMFSMLGGLLLLLQLHWIAAFVIFITCCIYIHFLVVIHTLYEQMLQGKTHGSISHEILIEEDDISTASQETGIITL